MKTTPVVKIKGDKEYEIAMVIQKDIPEDKTYGQRQVSFHVKNGIYTGCFSICRSPTGNCQLSSVANANVMFSCLVAGSKISKTDINLLLKEAYRQIGHTPLLVEVDVNWPHVVDVERCFTVVHKLPYISTNQSQMCLFLVRLV